jgi:hypothetical protein
MSDDVLLMVAGNTLPVAKTADALVLVIPAKTVPRNDLKI